VAIGDEYAKPGILITKPKTDYLYINGDDVFRIGNTVIIGEIQIETRINEVFEEIEKVEFYINDKFKASVPDPPYNYLWDELTLARIKHTIKAIAYYGEGKTLINEIAVWRFF
jgi:hypothetical protein